VSRVGAAAALVLSGAVAIGCGETVVTDGTGGGGGASGSGASGSGGSTPTCDPVPPFAGTFGWTYTSPDGALHDCSPDTEAADVDVVGAIVAGTTDSTWVIDACAPSQDCIPNLHTLTISTDAPLSAPPVGTIVHLVASIEHLSGPTPINCGQKLLVQNEPTWVDGDNPTASDGLPWLDPIDTDDGVFQASYSPVCTVDHPDPGCMWAETFYSVIVTYLPFADAKSAPLMGGDTASFDVPDGSGQGVTFDASYALMSNGNCENPGSSAVWVARAP
jgi:hypothetical protein